MNEELAVQIKQRVADPCQGPVLHDLLHDEAACLIKALCGDAFDLRAGVSDESVVARLDRYAELSRDLAHAFALGGRWSGDLVGPLWTSLLERVVAGVDRARSETVWADLSYYPGVLLLYADGIGALAGGRFDNLRSILLDPQVFHHNHWRRAVEILITHNVMDPRQAERVVGLPDTFAPISDRLAADLRPILLDVVPDDAAFERLFDGFEYLLGFVHLDVTRTGDTGWGPTGRFGAAQYGTGVDSSIEEEIKASGESWGPLAAGLFGGSAERLNESLKAWRQHVEVVRREARFHHLR